MAHTTDKRMARFRQVAARRQRMTVILENVHDPHNIGAVLRSCDAVGIDEVFILYTEEHLDFDRLDRMSSSSTGVRKWMNLHYFRDLEACFSKVAERYDRILATHLGKEAVSMYKCDLTEKIAFLFGNEHQGLSEAALKFAHGNIVIPQVGMAQSLNISVACAVTLFESMRQRLASGMYNDGIEEGDAFRQMVLARYIERHEASYRRNDS